MITLHDEDSVTEPESHKLEPPEDKYPRNRCPVLYKLIKTDALTRLVSANVAQVTNHMREHGPLTTFDVDYDVLIESERGLTLFGFPLFSPQLFPWDPPQFSAANGVQVNGPRLFPLPTQQWSWAWDRWHIMMIGDTDDQGWQYAWRFESRWWRARMVFGCVRRRLWIRLRYRDTAALEETNHSQTNTD